MLGFVTFGTPDQIEKAGSAMEKGGVHCGILKAEDGRTELMVIFDSETTMERAFSLYKRALDGEFGTSDTGYMLLPADAVKKK